METTIYLDVLFLLNLFVTWMLLMATARLMNLSCGKWRLLAGSVLGGVYSLLILFDLNAAELCAVKLLMGASLVFTVFWHRRSGRFFAKTALCFLLVNFLFAGVMMALWLFLPPPGMSWKNGVAYFDISALTLAVSTAAAYLVISLFSFFWNRRGRREELTDVRLELDGREVLVRCLADTGNHLSDIFTGLPVIVCEYGAVEGLLPARLAEFFRSPGQSPPEGTESEACRLQLRMIPVSTAGGKGSLPAFRPTGVETGGAQRRAMVAVTGERLSDGSFQGILNAALLE